MEYETLRHGGSAASPAGSMLQRVASGSAGEISAVNSGLASIISSVQLWILLLFMLLIPSIFLPFPWGWVEYAKGIAVLGFGTLFISLEAVKVLFVGKFTAYKDKIDVFIIVFLLSYLVSALFSRDVAVSLWGFEDRMGNGLVFFAVLAMFTYVMRNCLRTRSNLRRVLAALLVGIALSASLSIASFSGSNILIPFDSMKELFVPGYPVTASALIGITMWGAGILLGVAYLLGSESRVLLLDSVLVTICSIISTVAIFLYSVTVSAALPMLLGVTFLGLTLLIIGFKPKGLKSQSMAAILLSVVLVLGVLFLRVDSVREKLLKASPIGEQINISTEQTWSIVVSTLSSSLRTGVFGMGVDTFSIYFNLNKEFDAGSSGILNSNLTYGSSEILTLMGNRGVLGALIWLLFGVYLFYNIGQDYRNKQLLGDSTLELLVFDLLLIFLYMSSFFTYYGPTLNILMLLAINGYVVLKSNLNFRNSESIVLQIDLLTEKIGQTRNGVVQIGASISLLLLMLWGCTLQFNNFRGAWYVLDAENRVAKANAMKADDRSFDDNRKLLLSVIGKYSAAIAQDDQNTLYWRRAALFTMDYINLLSTRLDNEKKESDEQRELTDEISRSVEVVTEQSKKATELNPNIYANWDARSMIYSELVSIGLDNFANSGLVALDNAVRLNPTNYLLYLRASTLFTALGENEKALEAVGVGLQINPNHVPSILVASELSIGQKNYDQSLQLLNRAKQILEALEQRDSELYKSVNKRIDEVNDLKLETDEEANDLEEEGGEE